MIKLCDKKVYHQHLIQEENIKQWLVGGLVVFNVPSTVRSFRDGTPFTVPCQGREAL